MFLSPVRQPSAVKYGWLTFEEFKCGFISLFSILELPRPTTKPLFYTHIHCQASTWAKCHIIILRNQVATDTVLALVSVVLTTVALYINHVYLIYNHYHLCMHISTGNNPKRINERTTSIVHRSNTLMRKGSGETNLNPWACGSTEALYCYCRTTPVPQYPPLCG